MPQVFLENGGELCKNASENASLANVINPLCFKHQTISRNAVLNEQSQTSLQLINRDRAHRQSTTLRLDRQQPPQLRDPSISSSSASSSYSNIGQQPHLDIQMIECNKDMREREKLHNRSSASSPTRFTITSRLLMPPCF